MKNHTFAMLALLLFCTPIFGQQWSSDPVTDSLKIGTAALLKYQAWLDYCKGEHSHDKECEGIYDHLPWQYMDYEDAVKLGQKQLDEEKARKERPKAAEASVAEVARHYEQLKQLEQQVKEFCGKNPAVKSCKERTPYQLAQELLPQVQNQVQVQKGASPSGAAKPTQ
jgi:hypothetical protein